MNSMYFSKEDVEAGLMTELINYLCKYSYGSGPKDFSHYNDIHIIPDDGESFVVEWEQRPWSGNYGGMFQYVDEGQVVCNEVEFPDKHFEYTPEDPDEAIKEWLEENPAWEKDEWGHWHETDMYIPKKSSSFTFHIFDPDSGETIAKDIPLSDEKAKEIFDNLEKIKPFDYEVEDESNI